LATESIPTVQSVLNTNWNRGNTTQRKPVVMDVATVDSGRGKRFDLTSTDGIFLYESGHQEEQPELFYDFVTTRINVTIDARTMLSRDHLMKMEDEIRRIIHLKRKGDGSNFDRLIYKNRVDLSDRTKRLFRMTFQVEIVIFVEAIAT